MYGFRKDGIAVKLPTGIYNSREAAIDFALMNDCLAVIYENSHLFTRNKSSFTKQLGALRVLPTVPDNAKLFMENELINDLPFYTRGIFGINSKGELYTKLYTQELTTMYGNTYRIFIQGSDVVFLSTYSPETQQLKDMMSDIMQVAAETHSPGKQMGLRITPKSTGVFNMKQ